MKILHLLYESDGDYFGVGGVAVRAYEIYKRLKNRHDITLLCKKYEGAKNCVINELDHIFVGSVSTNLTNSLLSYGYESARYLKQYGDSYDLIIDEFSPAIPSFSHLCTKTPIILQMQGYTDYHYFRKYNPISALCLYLSEKIRPIFYENLIVINQHTLEKLPVNKYKNFLILPNGIDIKMLQHDYYEGDYILYLGRIDYYAKGLDLLLKAYSEVLKKFQTVKLLIAGDGRDRELLKRELSKLPDTVRKNISTTGWIQGEKKIDILKGANFCVLPSRHETQGITLLEAMACKKALIVSDINELGYAVHCGAGVSFKNGSYQSLKDRMIEYLSCPSSLITKGNAGYEWVKEFTWDKISSKYDDFLVKVLRGQ